MHMTQKPKFHRLRDQMNNYSRKNIRTKLFFPTFMVFPLQCHTFANRRKCDFREIRQEMVEFQNYIKSSEMVVRGWYMTHFDRRDILKSKKFGLGRFRDFSGATVLILSIFTIFFGKFRPEP